MERFKDLRLFDEAKDNIISRLDTLTDEQKKQVVEFFRAHNDFENRIDWNRAKSKSNPLTWKDFEDLMTEVEGRKLPKEGLKDLTEGVDYVKLKSPIDFIQVYAILNHRASVAIASNNTEPKVWSNLPSWYQTSNVEDDYPFDKSTGLYGGAKWCTAMHHTDIYFRRYTKNRGILVYYIQEHRNKFAILYKNEDDSLSISGVWDEADNEIPVSAMAERIRELNKEKLMELINLKHEDLSGNDESSDRDEAVERFGEDAVEAFEEYWDDDEIPYRELDHYYLGGAEDAEDLYSDMDITVNYDTLIDMCDLEAVGEDIWRYEKQSFTGDELKEMYPQYWDGEDWNVDYADLAGNYLDDILPNSTYIYLYELHDNYKFIYDKINFDRLAEADGFVQYNGYWFSSW